jgi:hypothetical protein
VPPSRKRKNLLTDGQKRYPDGGGERTPAKGLGRLRRELDPKEVLKRDFDKAVDEDDLPSFFAAYPEVARMGWRHEEAERSRTRRNQASDEDRAAASADSATRMRRRRSLMSEQERAALNARRRENYQKRQVEQNPS